MFDDGFMEEIDLDKGSGDERIRSLPSKLTIHLSFRPAPCLSFRSSGTIDSDKRSPIIGNERLGGGHSQDD